MKEEQDPGGSATAGSALTGLQQQLLIELLRRNIDAASKGGALSQDPLPLTSPLRSSASTHIPSLGTDRQQGGGEQGGGEQVMDKPNGDKHTRLLQVCERIGGMVASLAHIQQSLCVQADKQRTDELTAKHIRLFLGKIRRVKDLLDDRPVDPIPFELVKTNVLSLAKYLQAEKRRLHELNEDYVHRVAEGRVQRQEFGRLVAGLLDMVHSVKEELGAGPGAGIVDWDSHLQQHFVDLTAAEHATLVRCIQANVSTSNAHAHSLGHFGDFDQIPVRMASLAQALDSIHSVCAGKLADYKRQNGALRGEVSRLKSVCESQQSAAAEAARRYEEEVSRLSAELDASKAREQTTPPTSVTRKRRVLPDTVVAFTGLSKEPQVAQELSAAIVELGGRVHSSADFTTDITHVVCPAGYQSVRTMAAALSSKWVVSTDWITQSKKAGRLLDEATFGRLFPGGPATLRAKTFYMTAKFTSQQARHQMNAACCRTLIEPIARGKLTDDITAADYVLCGDGEERRARNWLRLKDFIRMIPGHAID